MPENIYNIVMWTVAGGLAAVYLLAMVRMLGKRFAPVKTVKAEVVGKQKTESFSKYAGTGRHVRYVVVFMAEGKKRSFYVSEFSYGGYRCGEKGTLKYKGDRILDFS